MYNIHISGILAFSLLTNLLYAGDTLEQVIVKYVNCDSIYPNKNYVIKLSLYNDSTEDGNNAEFNLFQSETKLYTDSIFSSTRQIEFADFNNDDIQDILIQNSSDVRSNWTYNLYVVDLKNNKLTKIKGFEEIKNPRYNHSTKKIESYVISGTNRIEFYKTQSDSIIKLQTNK